MSAGDEPHSRLALIILLSVELVCLLILASLAVYSNVQMASGGGIVIMSVVETVLYIFGLIFVCVGLAGAARRDPRALLGFFVCGILYIVAYFFLSIIRLALINQATYGGVGQAFFQGFTIIVPVFTLPILTGAAVTLAKRGYQQLRHSETTQTAYKHSMLGSFLSCAIVSLYFIVSYWFLPYVGNSSDYILQGIIIVAPLGFNLIALILALIGASGCVSPRDEKNLLLAFFIMEILYMLSVFAETIYGAYILGWLACIFTVAGLVNSYFIGANLTLAWLHRKNLLGEVEYYALNDDHMHH
jgi:hypothetical protein